MWVVWSADGGSMWDGGGGAFPERPQTLTRSQPLKSAPSNTSSPRLRKVIPATPPTGWPGTNDIEPTDPLGKRRSIPADAADLVRATAIPTFDPPVCSWNLYAGQSLNLTSSPTTATWTTGSATTTPMHVGDICNLGIFCVDPNSNRNLLDFISETVDPTTGFAHVAYADDNTVNKLRVANQTGGPNIGP